MRLSYDTTNISPELAAALAAIDEEYPISGPAGDALPVAWLPGGAPGSVHVQVTADGARITYDTLAQALRGLGWQARCWTGSEGGLATNEIDPEDRT